MEHEIFSYKDMDSLLNSEFFANHDQIPLFLSSANLAQALKQESKADKAPLFLSFVEFFKRNDIFSNFLDQPHIKMQQIFLLEEVVLEKYRQKIITSLEYESFLVNKYDFLEGICTAILLDLDCERLSGLMSVVLHEIQDHPLFLLSKVETIEHFNEICGNSNEKIDLKINSVIFFNIHQFSPLELCFFRNLKEIGLKILFLVPIYEEFTHISASWQRIYGEFSSEMIPFDQTPINFSDHNEAQVLGKNLAIYFEERKIKERNFSMVEYSPCWNAGNHSEIHNISENNHKKEAIIPNNIPFFLALFDLWDKTGNKIRMESGSLKICFENWWFSDISGLKMLRMYYKLEILMGRLEEFSEFQAKIALDYASNLEKMRDLTGSPLGFMGIYDCDSLAMKELDEFVKGIFWLEEVAEYLFKNASNIEEFEENRKRIREFQQEKQHDLRKITEISLLVWLNQRLNLQMQKEAPPSAILDSVRTEVRRNLELIQQKDHKGKDLISSVFQQKKDETIEILVKDSDFHIKPVISQYLENHIGNALEKSKYGSIYLKSKKELTEYHKYLLFYALYFSKGPINLKYPAHEEPYAPLLRLGCASASAAKTHRFSLDCSGESAQVWEYDRYKAMTFFLCSARFYRDYIVNSKPCRQDKQLYTQLYDSIIIMELWNLLSGMSYADAISILNGKIDEVATIYDKYFWFLEEMEKYDAQNSAKRYLFQSIFKEGQTVRPYAASHMQMKLLFGEAWFEQEVGPNRNFPAFEKLLQERGGFWKYSLHKVPKSGENPLNMDLQQEIFQAIRKNDFEETAGDWCKSCSHRELCSKKPSEF